MVWWSRDALSEQPHLDFTGWPHLIAVLPSANDRGVMADLFRKLALTPELEVERAVDVIGFHEFGHALNAQYLYVRAPGTTALSVRWFDEFMATYMGQGYLWHTEGADTDPLRGILYRDYVPPHTSLAEFEEHLPELITPEGWINYGWYQVQFAERGRAVFARQGIEFITRVRDKLPWDRYQEWSTAGAP